MWAFSHIYGKEFVDSLMPLFADKKPPFLLSSMMPFFEANGRKTRMYPAPAYPPKSDDKKMRKAKLCTEDALKALAQNNFETTGLGYKSGILFSEKESDQPFFRDDEEKGSGIKTAKIFSKQTAERTAVNRITGGSMDRQLFFDKTTSFGKNAGLYFLIEAGDTAYAKNISAALKFLEDDGIGPNVSTGSGSFEFKGIEAATTPLKTNGSHFITLSPYRPDSSEFPEIKGKNTWYALGRKKASIKSLTAICIEKPIWKRSYSFFREGSILPTQKTKVHGTFPLIVHKGENIGHDVYAYLYAFPLYLEVSQ